MVKKTEKRKVGKAPPASDACHVCGGAMTTATTTLDVEHRGELVRIDRLPCHRCKVCGEEVFDARVSKGVEEMLACRTAPDCVVETKVYRFRRAA
jgi:YgiT-type zinc finger domain-containing protein